MTHIAWGLVPCAFIAIYPSPLTAYLIVGLVRPRIIAEVPIFPRAVTKESEPLIPSLDMPAEDHPF